MGLGRTQIWFSRVFAELHYVIVRSFHRPSPRFESKLVSPNPSSFATPVFFFSYIQPLLKIRAFGCSIYFCSVPCLSAPLPGLSVSVSSLEDEAPILWSFLPCSKGGFSLYWRARKLLTSLQVNLEVIQLYKINTLVRFAWLEARSQDSQFGLTELSFSLIVSTCFTLCPCYRGLVSRAMP